MEILNEYSGLFSLLAVVVSVVAIVVSVVIFNKQKKEQAKYYFMQKNDQEHFYNLQKKTKNISIKSNKTTIFKTWGMSMRL